MVSDADNSQPHNATLEVVTVFPHPLVIDNHTKVIDNTRGRLESSCAPAQPARTDVTEWAVGACHGQRVGADQARVCGVSHDSFSRGAARRAEGRPAGAGHAATRAATL